jgi:hypothetical protein
MQRSGIAQRPSLDSEVPRYQSAHQDKHESERISNATTSSSLYATPLTSSQLGTLNTFERTNIYNFEPVQSSLDADQSELNYARCSSGQTL